MIEDLTGKNTILQDKHRAYKEKAKVRSTNALSKHSGDGSHYNFGITGLNNGGSSAPGRFTPNAFAGDATMPAQVPTIIAKPDSTRHVNLDEE